MSDFKGYFKMERCPLTPVKRAVLQRIDLNVQKEPIFFYLLTRSVVGKMELRRAVDSDSVVPAHDGIPVMGSKANNSCTARASACHGQSRAQVGE